MKLALLVNMVQLRGDEHDDRYSNLEEYINALDGSKTTPSLPTRSENP